MSQTSVTSEATLLQSVGNFSYEISWTGTAPSGSLNLQVSNSYSVDGAGGAGTGTWTTVPVEISGVELTNIPISGSADNGFLDVTMNAGYAVRLLYTRSSGSGTILATIVGKVS